MRLLKSQKQLLVSDRRARSPCPSSMVLGCSCGPHVTCVYTPLSLFTVVSIVTLVLLSSQSTIKTGLTFGQESNFVCPQKLAVRWLCSPILMYLPLLIISNLARLWPFYPVICAGINFSDPKADTAMCSSKAASAAVGQSHSWIKWATSGKVGSTQGSWDQSWDRGVNTATMWGLCLSVLFFPSHLKFSQARL